MGPGIKGKALSDPNFQPPWMKMFVNGSDVGIDGYEVHYMLNPSGEWDQLKITKEFRY